MIDVTDGAYVAVRLIALKFLFCHFCFVLLNQVPAVGSRLLAFSN
jgi:hypothetical protein